MPGSASSFPPLDALIEQLELEPHPEGGYYRETWRSSRIIPGETLAEYEEARHTGTSILFLLPRDDRSQLHRIQGDELWVHQYGDPIRLSHRETREATPESVILGSAPDHSFQASVPAGTWQSAEPLEGPAGYGLVACVSIPGFEFDDLDIADDGAS